MLHMALKMKRYNISSKGYKAVYELISAIKRIQFTKAKAITSVKSFTVVNNLIVAELQLKLGYIIISSSTRSIHLVLTIILSVFVIK